MAYIFGDKFTTEEMRVRYLHLKEPFEDDKGKEYRATLEIDYDKSDNVHKLNFLRLLHTILKNKKGFVKPATGQEYIRMALDERVMYQTEVDGRKVYRLAPTQRTGFSYFDRKKNKNDIADFKVPVYNFLGDQYKQEEIPLVDDSYNTLAKVTMKVKNETGNNRLYLDLVAVTITDFKPYVSEKIIDNSITDRGVDEVDIDISEPKDSSTIFDEEIPF